MNKREKTIKILKWIGVGGVVLLLCGIVIPALIKGGFYLLLQGMLHPFIAMIVVVNCLVWQMVYIRYTERKKNQLK